MAYSDTNPVVTAQIGVKSSSISSAVINAYCSFTMRKRGSLTDSLDVSSGVQRFTPGQTGATKIIEADNVTADKNGFIYIKNLSTDTTEYATITINSEELGRLYAQDWLFIPWSAEDTGADVKITPSVATSMKFDYVLVHE